jgi:hypothetical protein
MYLEHGGAEENCSCDSDLTPQQRCQRERREDNDGEQQDRSIKKAQFTPTKIVVKSGDRTTNRT